MNVFDSLNSLSPEIQAAAATVAFFHPEYCPAESLVADISLWIMDNDVLEDLLSFELFGERVWWLMAVGLRLVKAGMTEYENNLVGDDYAR